MEFTNNINPYRYTVQSFQKEGLEHGYAYPPTLLYIMSFMWIVNVWTHIDVPTAILWKIPIFIADLGIFLMIYKTLARKSWVLGIVGGAFWLLNPYFTSRYEFSSFEPIQVFFLLVALKYLGKRDSLAGLLFSLAVSVKLTPIILLPLFIFYSINKVKFLLWFLVIFVIISIPFMTNISDFEYYMKGAYLVHGDRELQGRPLLSFLSYLSEGFIKPYQNEFISFYVFASIVTGPILTILLMGRYKIKDFYLLSLVGFSCYFIFTPVLSRSHLLWLFPFIILGIPQIKTIKIWEILLSFTLVYLATYTYLVNWNKGLEVSPTRPGVVLLKDNTNNSQHKGMYSTLLNTYYDYRHRFF